MKVSTIVEVYRAVAAQRLETFGIPNTLQPENREPLNLYRKGSEKRLLRNRSGVKSYKGQRIVQGAA